MNTAIDREFWVLNFGGNNFELSDLVDSFKNAKSIIFKSLDIPIESLSRLENGDFTMLYKLIKEKNIKNLLLIYSEKIENMFSKYYQQFLELPVNIYLLQKPNYYGRITMIHANDNFNNLFIKIKVPAISGVSRVIKRLIDVVLASVLIVMLLPIMAFIAYFIWLDDGSPVLFKQIRVGELGKKFVMYKFRTMVKNAESLRNLVEKKDKNGNLIHKYRNDPRVTRVGKFLRHYSLDELPQLLNILKGEMSLIGPRPELPYIVERYKLWQFRRLTVPQGLTGWWQVNGRSEKLMHLHTEDDIYYIENFSLWLDLKILLKTAKVVVFGIGAF